MHNGTEAEGKYSSIAQNARSKKWYRYDDTTVRPINEEEVVSQSAYLLFYKLVKTSERQANLNKDGLWGVQRPADRSINSSSPTKTDISPGLGKQDRIGKPNRPNKPKNN